MGRIYKNGGCIYQMVLHTLFKDVGKDLFKQVCIFKTPCIIFPKSRKVGNRIQHIQTEEPSVSYIHFDFFHRLSHAFDPVEILDKRNFDQHHWIHTRATIICTIFIFYKIVNESPVNCALYFTKHMVFWHHVIHAEHHHLFSFFIGISCHHKRHPPIR